MMCDITNAIKEIANDIPDDMSIKTLSDFIEEQKNNIFYYRGIIGYSTSECLLNDDKMGVALSNIPKGHTVIAHVHKNPIKEFLFVKEGLMKIEIGGNTNVLGYGDYIKIESDVEHVVSAIEDVVVLAITIPRDEGFPK